MKNSGVLMLFFDLHVLEKKQRTEYRRFVKYIKSVGFMMLQESVYVRLQRSVRSTPFDIAELKSKVPESGSVIVLPLTASNFMKMQFLSGGGFDVSFLCDDVIYV